MRSTRSRWRRLRISSQSRHSEPTVRTNRSAIAFAFGDRTGVFTIRMPSLRKNSSKAPLYLLSRSRMRKRTPLSLKSRPRLRACCVTHSPVGVPRAAGKPDTTARMRDEEEHVEAAQQDRLNREEVTRDDAARLRAQELAPTRAAATRRRLQTRAREKPPDARR